MILTFLGKLEEDFSNAGYAGIRAMIQQIADDEVLAYRFSDKWNDEYLFQDQHIRLLEQTIQVS
jgi:hypothetical protein